MSKTVNRRDFLKLAGMGGVVFASGLGFDVLAAGQRHKPIEDFYFAQFSDTHWGFKGQQINPDAEFTLPKAIQSLNSLVEQPDFVVFTGDLTHTTDDVAERRRRMQSFREQIDKLEVKNIKFVAGEHDAALDKGAVYKEYFGDLYYRFQHKGLNFFVLDNVSDPAAQLGAAQLDWLKTELQKLIPTDPIVVFTHRPLFDLYPQWDWATRDGQAALDLLIAFQNVAVFYGHIHQSHRYYTQHIPHYASKSLIFPLPAPGSVSKRVPIPWNAAQPYSGLGYQNVQTAIQQQIYLLDEISLVKEVK